jgi:alpha-mannosidase
VIQDVYIYQDVERVDFETYVDWGQSQLLLKAAFPVDVHADKATYDIQFGNLERPTHRNTSWDVARFEVCAHKWADLSEGGFGVSLLNDCKYGYDVRDGMMRLTLLKSGVSPYEKADQEEHWFTYALYPHSGDWRVGRTVQMGYRLNVPLYACLEEAHEGNLPSSASMIEVDRDNVVIEAVKKAEDSEDIVVRLYECHNRRDKVTLRFYGELTRAEECTLMEQELRQLPVADDSISFDIRPYEIKTFKLRVTAAV